ncbi:MAG: signal peptidase I [Clostridiales bacterium]|nr:signal peptidase I [Clostridiales bacterium]
MSQEQEVKGIESGGAAVKPKKHRARAVFKYTGLCLLLVILVALVINSILSIFMPHYYPTFGDYRLFAIVSDSMDPTIPEGHMIVVKVPESEKKDNIKAGTIITFEVEDKDGNITVLTHRVIEVIKNPNTGKTSYTTKGDNKNVRVDSIHPDYDDVIGIYTGKHCGFFGYLFGFLQSAQGAVTLIVILFIIAVAWIVIAYLKKQEKRKALETAALKKSAQELADVSQRYENIHEIAAVMDVIGMVTEEPKTRTEDKELEQRLGEFIETKSVALEKTQAPETAPETAAAVDAQTAPVTTSSLAESLRNGATLRSAEDGQTLILSGMSGGKSIVLTPVQTPEGIILCQQGVRLRSDIAPGVDSNGATSNPDYPEFFEGQPLEKAEDYPELPQPKHRLGDDGARLLSSHSAYAQYREQAAQLELKQVEELNTLLSSTEPLSPEEKARISAYKEERKKQKPVEPPKEKKKPTPEQLAARKEAAEKRKAEQEAFLNSLEPADRELYLSEQKLAKARAATIRRLKRINSDRKLLAKIK